MRRILVLILSAVPLWGYVQYDMSFCPERDGYGGIEHDMSYSIRTAEMRNDVLNPYLVDTLTLEMSPDFLYLVYRDSVGAWRAEMKDGRVYLSKKHVQPEPSVKELMIVYLKGIRASLLEQVAVLDSLIAECGTDKEITR
jgi:hypothetical protein